MKKPDETVTIAGKLCESGDIIIRDAKLPSSVQRGDYLAILSTGAYHYSMALITTKCRNHLYFS